MKKIECEISSRWLEIDEYAASVMCGDLVCITLKTKNIKGRNRTICTSYFKLAELQEALNAVKVKE